MARIVELTSQLQLADSKSVHFYAEVSGELIGFGVFSPHPFRNRVTILVSCCSPEERSQCPYTNPNFYSNTHSTDLSFLS